MGSGEQSSPTPDASRALASSRAETLKKLIASRPGDPFPRYGLAHEYKNAGRLAEARDEFVVLMRDHPDYTAAYLHAGNVLLALGDRGEARAVFERGIEVCRRRGDGHAMSELEGALSSLDR
jgi:tetratricopeptide (TPR) repeat protein